MAEQTRGKANNVANDTPSHPRRKPYLYESKTRAAGVKREANGRRGSGIFSSDCGDKSETPSGFYTSLRLHVEHASLYLTGYVTLDLWFQSEGVLILNAQASIPQKTS
ncbi:unnamed protein product [Euphydryas editha]|uniref:Uncharacterized protein n=1 Tax=Euphydryas editha TaxID=104508 RepID=A0AAU9V313_EUPED|nr:unnamed protein product [Euphydryas editha]